MLKKNNTKRPYSGFTIIEVVLVLAIAGLIFLMVFLALPALQRSQRDTQRRDDLSGFSTQITNYQSNNRGKVPQHPAVGGAKDEWPDFFNNYMKQNNGEFVDPDGTKYQPKVSYNTNPPSTFDHKIYIYYGQKCDGEKIVPATGNYTRQIAFAYKLEGGGVFCGSNS